MVLCVLKRILHKKKSISEIAQTALIVNGYFWNSTSRSHSNGYFWNSGGVKGMKNVIMTVKYPLFFTPRLSISLEICRFSEPKIPPKYGNYWVFGQKTQWGSKSGYYRVCWQLWLCHEQKPVFLFFNFFLGVFTMLDLFASTSVKTHSCSQSALPLNVCLIIGSNGSIMYFGGISNPSYMMEW